jgi:catechol 2,3-dioxygenase-like lactoylglutathione lyase family enzyme
MSKPLADHPKLLVTSVTVSAPDPVALARFYQKLLGWSLRIDGAWAQLRSPETSGLMRLNFEEEPDYVPPAWPAVAGAQQIMEHLDIAVDDLDATVAWALEAGAALADYQPQETVRVMLDPAGHPFCLFLAAQEG